MLEQTTIRDGIQLAQSWGPVASLAALWIIYQIAYGFHIKRNAVDPLKDFSKEIIRLRDTKGKILDEIRDLKIESQKSIASVEKQMERRVTYEWAEKQLIPKIDELGKDVNKLSVTVENHTHMGNRIAETISGLTKSITEMQERVNSLNQSRK